jgi:hypothetical protein
MQSELFSAGATPRVTITESEGPLAVEFWDERSFAVEPAGAAAAADADGTLVIHAARGGLRLRVPAATAIAVERHTGEVRIAAIDASVRLRDIDGDVTVSGAAALVIERDETLPKLRWSFGRPRRDVTLRQVGTAEIAQVHGGLSIDTAQRATVGPVGGSAAIRAVAGDLRLGDVGGSCEITQVGGALELGCVGGSCALEGVAGSVSAGEIGGSAELRATGAIAGLGSIGGSLTLTDARLGGTRAGQLTVGGSARIELPEAANLTIDAVVGGRVSGHGIAGGPGMRRVVYGDGSAHMRLVVGGSLTLA